MHRRALSLRNAIVLKYMGKIKLRYDPRVIDWRFLWLTMAPCSWSSNQLVGSKLCCTEYYYKESLEWSHARTMTANSSNLRSLKCLIAKFYLVKTFALVLASGVLVKNIFWVSASLRLAARDVVITWYCYMQEWWAIKVSLIQKSFQLYSLFFAIISLAFCSVCYNE